MNIYIDFDDTLLHRTRMTDDIFSAIGSPSADVLKEHYRQFRKDHPFTIHGFERYLIAQGIDGAQLSSSFYRFAKRSAEYVFNDARDFLVALKAAGHRVCILSFDAEPATWQRPKIEASQLTPFVDEIFVTAIPKSDFLTSIGVQDPFIFIDDKQSEIDAMHSAFPQAVCIKHEPGTSLLSHMSTIPKQKNVVVMGGGTGVSIVLKALRDFPVALCAIVSTMDDGSSSGRLLSQLGTLTAPGDIRSCLIALSTADPMIQSLFSYRFTDGDLKGHPVGNILLSAAEKSSGSFEAGLELLQPLLQPKGDIIPVTLSRATLGVRHGEKKTEILGEHIIDDCKSLERPREYFLQPSAMLNPRAKLAIQHADVIIIGPGSFSTSLIPVLIVEGMREAIASSNAKIIFNANLTTTPGQSDGETILDMLHEIEAYLPRPVDKIVYHNQPFPESLVFNGEPVGQPAALGVPTAAEQHKLVGADLLLKTIIPSTPGDPIVRKAIGHDPQLLGTVLFDLIESL